MRLKNVTPLALLVNDDAGARLVAPGSEVVVSLELALCLLVRAREWVWVDNG